MWTHTGSSDYYYDGVIEGPKTRVGANPQLSLENCPNIIKEIYPSVLVIFLSYRISSCPENTQGEGGRVNQWFVG